MRRRTTPAVFVSDETPTAPPVSECEKWDCDGDHRYYSHDPETGKLVPWSDEL